MLKKPPSHLFSDEIPTKIEASCISLGLQLRTLETTMLKPYTLVPAMSHLHRYNKTQVTVGGGKRDVGKGVGLVLGKRVSVLEMDKRLEING